MTEKQEQFVREYLIDLNATQAAIRAGYSVKTAYRIGANLLQKSSVREAIEKAQAERAKRVELTADYVLDGLREVAERCRQAEPVLDRKGNPTGEYQFDSGGANRALELLGKHLGLFVERKELTGKDGGPIEHNHNLFDAETRAAVLAGLEKDD